MLSSCTVSTGCASKKWNLPNQRKCLSKCFSVSETHWSFSLRNRTACSVPTNDLQGVVWLNAAALEVVKRAKISVCLWVGFSLANELFLEKKSLKRKQVVLFYYSLFVACFQHVIRGKRALRMLSSTQFGSKRAAFRADGRGYWIQKKCLDWEIDFLVKCHCGGKRGRKDGGWRRFLILVETMVGFLLDFRMS